MHTRWIETEFDGEITPFNALAAHAGGSESESREDVVVEVNGKRVSVSVPSSLANGRLGAARP